MEEGGQGCGGMGEGVRHDGKKGNRLLRPAEARLATTVGKRIQKSEIEVTSNQ